MTTILRLVILAMVLCAGCRAAWDASSDAGAVHCSTDDATCNVLSDAYTLKESSIDGDVRLDLHLNAATGKSGRSPEAKVQAESDGHDLASMLQSRLEMVQGQWSYCNSDSDCLWAGPGYTCVPIEGDVYPYGNGKVCQKVHDGPVFTYKYGLINSNSCPDLTTPIASEEDCREAARSLHVSFRVSRPSSRKPKGCYHLDLGPMGTSISFNSHDAGSSYSACMPVCKELQCQSESDCPHGGTGYICMDSLCQATCASFSASSCPSNSLVDNAASIVCTDSNCSSPANDNLCCKPTCGSYDCAQNGFISIDDPESTVCTDSTCSRPDNDHVCCKATCSSYSTSQCTQNALFGVDDPSGTACTDLSCSSPANDNVCCKACHKPNGCTGRFDQYLNVDCDGDGLLDHMCTYHSTGNMRLVLTTEGCPQPHPDGGGSWGPVRQASECCAWAEHEGVEAVAASGLINPGSTKFDFEDAKARCLERGQVWCKAVTCETIPLPSHLGGGTKCTLRSTTTMVTPSSSGFVKVKTYVPTAGCLP